MLSGIGPKSQLQNSETKTNIDVLVDLPVGRNLWDHPLCTVTAATNLATAQTDLHQWSNGPEVAIFHKGDDKGKLPNGDHFSNRRPDIQHSCKFYSSILEYEDLKVILNSNSLALFTGSASIFDQSIINPSNPNIKPFVNNGFTIAPVLNIPESVGWLELKSDNPIDSPKIFVNYYNKPSDLYRMMSAIKLARKVVAEMGATELGFKDQYGHWQSGNEMTDEEYEKYIRSKVYILLLSFYIYALLTGSVP